MTHVRTKSKLATALGIPRQTLNRWVKAGVQGGPVPPKALAKGHNLAAWRAFVLKHNVAFAAEKAAPDEMPTKQLTAVARWKAEKVRLECVRLQRENDDAFAELVPVAELQGLLRKMVAAFSSEAFALIPRAVPRVRGLRDFHDIEEILQAEIATMLRTLEACPFLPAEKTKPKGAR
jgi:hypothetical protein